MFRLTSLNIYSRPLNNFLDTKRKSVFLRTCIQEEERLKEEGLSFFVKIFVQFANKELKVHF